MSFKAYVNENFTKSIGYSQAEERIEHLVKVLDPKGALCRGISTNADNVKREFTEMHKQMLAVQGLWEEVDHTISMNS